MFWIVQSKQQQRQYYKPCAHPANLEYLVANSWCLQKPYSMFEDPGAVSWVRKYGGERFQERVRDPLGRYS